MPAVADPPLLASSEVIDRAKAVVDAAVTHEHINEAFLTREITPGAPLSWVRSLISDLHLSVPPSTRVGYLGRKFLEQTLPTRGGFFEILAGGLEAEPVELLATVGSVVGARELVAMAAEQGLVTASERDMLLSEIAGDAVLEDAVLAVRKLLDARGRSTSKTEKKPARALGGRGQSW